MGVHFLLALSPAGYVNPEPADNEHHHVVPQTRPLRVLIADDERDEVATLAALLSEEGHQVREIYRGDAVAHHVRDFAPHVVLLDIGMPGMNGYEVAKGLRDEYGEKCPVLIAVTAWDKGTHRMYGKIAGFKKYITKPYDPTALLALLPLLVR